MCVCMGVFVLERVNKKDAAHGGGVGWRLDLFHKGQKTVQSIFTELFFLSLMKKLIATDTTFMIAESLVRLWAKTC